MCTTHYFVSLVSFLDAELKDNKITERWIECDEKSRAAIGIYQTVHLLNRLLQFLSLRAKCWDEGGRGWGNTIIILLYLRILLSSKSYIFLEDLFRDVLHEHTLYYTLIVKLFLQPLPGPTE